VTGKPITFQLCAACAARWYLERERCARCGSTALTSQPASGEGRVFAVTIVHRAPDAEFAALVPYRIALVDLDEGVRVMGHLVGEAEIGSAVTGSMELVAGREIGAFRVNTPDT
jgi:uncharacterized OB-fold protein